MGTKNASSKKAAKKSTKPAVQPKPRKAKATKPRDARLPAVGATLEKEHDGKTHKVLCLEHGFEFRGTSFRSLSAIAKEITGTTWNGYLFFGLVTRGGKKAA